MALTAKQEAFAQAVASGKSQSDAYRTAYQADAMKAETVQNSAYKLMQNGEVAARVESLKRETADKHLWTREDSVRRLREVADKEDARGTEVVAAIKELNLMHGFNAPTKIELNGEITLIERRIVKAK